MLHTHFGILELMTITARTQVRTLIALTVGIFIAAIPVTVTFAQGYNNSYGPYMPRHQDDRSYGYYQGYYQNQYQSYYQNYYQNQYQNYYQNQYQSYYQQPVTYYYYTSPYSYGSYYYNYNWYSYGSYGNQYYW